VSAEPDVRYASWLSRVFAYLIDVALILVAIVVIYALVLPHVSQGVGIAIFALVILGGAFGYWAVCEATEAGQTLGKRALGIRVRSTSGARASYGQAFGRNLVRLVLGFISIVGIVDGLWPLWDARNQSMHDKIASTIVTAVPR